MTQTIDLSDPAIELQKGILLRCPPDECHSTSSRKTPTRSGGLVYGLSTRDSPDSDGDVRVSLLDEQTHNYFNAASMETVNRGIADGSVMRVDENAPSVAGSSVEKHAHNGYVYGTTEWDNPDSDYDVKFDAIDVSGTGTSAWTYVQIGEINAFDVKRP